MQASTAGGYTGCIITVFVHHSVSRSSRSTGEVVAAFCTVRWRHGHGQTGKKTNCSSCSGIVWWVHARAARVTAAAILFHETNTRFAVHRHIARLATRCAVSITDDRMRSPLAFLRLSLAVIALTAAAQRRPRGAHFRGPHCRCRSSEAQPCEILITT